MKKLLPILALSILFAHSVLGQNALHFDGSNDYVQTTFSGVLGFANRTFEAWIYVNSGLTSTNCIMDYGLNAVGSRNTFSVNSNYQLVYISGGTNANISSSSNAVTPGQWTHVAFVLNSGTGYLYANGTLVGSGSLTTVNTPSGNTNLRFGQRVSGGSIPFPGVIDEVRIWNVARTAADLSNSMNGEFCGTPSGLVAYYTLNHGTAGGTNTGVTTAIDAVSANNGTLNNFSLSGSSSNWVAGKTLSSSSQDSASITACGSYTPPSGSGPWTVSGNYIDTSTSSTGCDSILFIDLTVLPNSTSSLTTTACNKYTSPSGNNTWTTSGTYTDIVPNAVGCDSVITINLTINTVDTNVLVNNTTLTSWETGANYQWLDCSNGYAMISGATGQSYTPTANGSYAVEIDKGGCVDTSACYAINSVGIEENNTNGFSVFPNPAKDKITLSFQRAVNHAQIEIIDATGRVVLTARAKDTEKYIMPISLNSGVYFVKVIYGDKTMIRRISVL